MEEEAFAELVDSLLAGLEDRQCSGELAVVELASVAAGRRPREGPSGPRGRRYSDTVVVVVVVEVVDDSSSKAEDKRAEDLGGGKDFEGDLEDRKVKTEVKLQDASFSSSFVAQPTPNSRLEAQIIAVKYRQLLKNSLSEYQASTTVFAETSVSLICRKRFSLRRRFGRWRKTPVARICSAHCWAWEFSEEFKVRGGVDECKAR
ncbi:hypothetical protein TYRP_012343 [Tyrophagus putrescentiae]|nr:hypothetical protein TYRP_012343 [Tyrophagus putrescentiae]